MKSAPAVLSLFLFSVVASVLLSGPPAMADDVLPPAEVANLQVTRSGEDVVLSWNAVTTSIAGGAETIGAYRVYRGTSGSFVPDKTGGSNLIGSPAAAGFTDLGAVLPVGQAFFYLISAEDTSGNEGNTRLSKVITPPALSGSFSTSAASLSWTGAAPGPSTAGYNVLWGTAPVAYDTADDVGNVLGTSVFPLNEAITYYFAVLAYDQERNFALFSNEVSGALLAGGGPTEVCGRIASSATWSVADSPFIVTCDVTVFGDTSPFNVSPPPAVLTIEPGVVVRFNAGTGLTIGSGANLGGLVAQGTAASPIVFTANQTFPAAGFWDGLSFGEATLPSSVLDQAVVEFGGQAPAGAAVLIDASRPLIQRTLLSGSLNHGLRLIRGTTSTIDGITVRNVAANGFRVENSSPTIRNGRVEGAGGYGLSVNGTNSSVIQNNVLDHGLTFDSAAGEPLITGNTLERYDGFPARLGANDVGEFLTANTIEGEGPSSRLEILGERVETNATWPDPGFPLVVISGIIQVFGDAATPATLTIGAGNEIRFPGFTYLQIASGASRGVLLAQGTPAAPILLTSSAATPAPGQWGGLFLDSGAQGSVVEHLTVEYTGTSFSAGIRVQSAAPLIRDCVVRQSSVYGIYLSASAATVENCSISGTGNNGIRSDSSGSPTLRGNTVVSPTGYGFFISGTGSPRLENNVVANSVFFDSAAGDPFISGNTFSNYGSFPARVGADDVAEFVSMNTIQGSGPTSRLEILGETLATDRTWPNPGFPYVVVSGDITIARDTTAPATLVLDPGVTMKFASFSALFVGTNTNRGALVAVGTPAQPILFTTNNPAPAPGQWEGINFDQASEDATSRLERVTVEYAGQSFLANVRCDASSPTIRDSVLRNSSSRGVYATLSSSPSILNNLFSGNTDFDAYFSGVSNAQVAGNTFSSGVLFDTTGGTHAVTGNTFNNYNTTSRNVRVGAHAVVGMGTNLFNGTGPNSRVEILGETLTADATWPSLGFPYAVLGDIVVAKDTLNASTLTIAPGAAFRFNSFVGLFVGTSTSRGALVAAGTPALPILFTTNNTAPAPGQWEGIYFDNLSDDATSRLENVTVEYAGMSNLGNVRCDGSAPTIRNSVLRNSSSRGIYGTASSSPTIDGNTFSGNTDFDVYMAGVSNAQVTGNTLTSGVLFDTTGGTHAVTGNTFDNYNTTTRNVRVGAHAVPGMGTNTFNGTGPNSRVEILGETLTTDVTWPSLGLPYAVLSDIFVAKDAVSASTLTIQPGAAFRFNSFVGLFVGTSTSRGALVAAGTPALPILFTTNNATPAPGQWEGIYFDTLSDDATSRLENVTVEYAGQTFLANVRCDASSPVIRSSTLRNSSSRGIYATASSSPAIDGNTFSGNTDFDVYVNTASNSQVTGNTFTSGVLFDTAAGTHAVTGNTFNNYDTTTRNVRVGAHAVSALFTNTFNGTGPNSRIEVLGETLAGDDRWRDLGFPYIVVSGNVFVSGTLTSAARLVIDPGVETRFASSTRLIVASGTTQGELIAVGTATDPILFTTAAASPAPGQWFGILLDNGTSFDTVIEHAVVEYAGQSNTAGIWLVRADPPIRNTTVRFSSFYGIASQESSPILQNVTVSGTGNVGMLFQGLSANRTPSISGCVVSAPTGYGILNQSTMSSTITGCTVANGIFFDSAAGRPVVQNNVLENYDAFPLRIGADSIASLTGNTFDGTGPGSRIEVLGETLDADATWANLGLPYQVVSGLVTVSKSVTQSATLTLEPGITMKFATGTGLQAASGSNRGALRAVGTPSQPIVFTTSSASPAPGQWRAIRFDPGTVDAASLLQHCVVEFGGQTELGNIFVSDAAPTIRDCTIRRSSAHGLNLSSAAPAVMFNQIVDNGAYGVLVSSGNPMIRHNNITGNTTGAVSQVSSVVADARLNWFGNASGPAHAGNPGGTGQPVTANVAYEPWLAAPFTTANYFADMFESTNTFRPGSLTRFDGQIVQDSSWTLRVFDSGGAPVRTIAGSGTTVETDWNGRDDASVALVNGPYRYQFDATGNATPDAAAPAVGRLTIDDTFAVGEMGTPDHLTTFPIGSLVTVLGSAGGSNFTNYTLQVGAGLFPTFFSNIVTSSTAVTNASLGTWNTAGQQNGVYSLRLLVNNNLTEQTVVSVGSFVLSVNTLAVDRLFFSPNGDGSLDETTANATLSTAADWTLTLVNTGTSATVKTFAGSGQSVSQTWDGTLADNTTIASEGTYRFDLVAMKDGQMVASSSASTALDLTPPAAAISAPPDGSDAFGSVAISGDAFDPDGHFQDYLLEFGVGTAPLTFNAIGTARTTPVTAGALGTWTTNDAEPIEPITNGGYQVRLTVNDRAGNRARATRQVNVDNLVLGAVATSRRTLDVGLGETARIDFSVNKPSTVTLKLHNEAPGEAGPILKSYTGAFPPGMHSFVWDGTGGTGLPVADEAYVYVLEADAGSGRTDRYSPSGGRGVGSGFGTIDPSYNPFTNDFWTMVYNNQTGGRVTMQVTPTGQPIFDVFTEQPSEVGNFTIEWDGRNAAGQIVTVGSSIYFPPPITMRPNYIITTGNSPRLGGIDADPYRIFMSYAHVSRFRFTLARDAVVTVTVLPPGVSNPADPSGRMIMANSALAAGDYTVLFDPIDPADPNEDTFRFGAEGPYTFAVQAVNPVSGATSLRRGVVSLFR